MSRRQEKHPDPDHESVTGLKEQLTDLRSENRLFKQILDEIIEGVYITDHQETITWLNRVAESSDDLRREDVLGRSEGEVYKNISRFHHITTSTGRPIPRRNAHYYLPNGRRTDLILTTKPYLENERLKAVYTIGYDLSRLHKLSALTQEMKHQKEVRKNHGPNQARYNFKDIVGASEVMTAVLSLAKKAANSRANVLISGETGTGKELVAQSIHNAGRNQGQFIDLNCAAIPETLLESILFGTVKGTFTGASENPGLFELAHGGTLFLDEINSMPLELQAKILRVLQEKEVRRLGDKKNRPVDCRIISATNADPLLEIKNKRIREDIYYRLATITLHIPPLRVRSGDLPLLVSYFLDKNSLLTHLRADDFSDEVWRLFRAYPWPGNVRELEHVIEYVLTMIESEATRVELKHLPPILQAFSRKGPPASQAPPANTWPRPELYSLPDHLNGLERDLIRQALLNFGGNLTQAAAGLGMSRQALTYRIKRLAKAGFSLDEDPIEVQDV